MTKQKLSQIFEDASNGLVRPQLAANLLVEVCEEALELFKTIEQQKAQIETHRRTHTAAYVP